MKLNDIFKYFITGSVSIIVLVLLIILITFLVYSYKLRGRELVAVDCANFKATLVYNPSGFGTSNYISIFTVPKNDENNKFLVYRKDSRDSARIECVDSNSIQIITLIKYDNSPNGWYWHKTDSIVLNLDSLQNLTR